LATFHPYPILIYPKTQYASDKSRKTGRSNAPLTVFVGMGGIFFRRDKAPKAEVINDNSRDVADRLKTIKGSFILSINNVPEIRKLFACFTLHEAKLHYSIAGKNSAGTTAKELIITNRAGLK